MNDIGGHDDLTLDVLRELEAARGEGICLAADIAHALDVSTPKVTARLTRLRGEGWVDAWFVRAADAFGYALTDRAVQKGPHVRA